MSKRLVLGSLVIIARLTAVAFWSHVSVQAETFADAPLETLFEEPVPEAADKDATPVTPGGETAAAAEAVPLAVFLGNSGKPDAADLKVPHPILPKGMEWVEESVIEKDGTVRKVMRARGIEKQPTLANDPHGSKASVENLFETYLELHRRIAERLTPGQLAEKCKALENELNELDAEIEIGKIQKQLSELKRKNADNKGISTRVQGAIEALKNRPPAEFKSL